MVSAQAGAYSRLPATEEATLDSSPVIQLPTLDTNELPTVASTSSTSSTTIQHLTVVVEPSAPSHPQSQSPPISPVSNPPSPVNAQQADQVSLHGGARRGSSFSTFTQRIYGSVDPSLHTLIEKDVLSKSTSREYSHKKQRKRLLRLTIGEWFNTLILCLTYFGILYAYSKKITIDVRQRRVFNALSTANSLLLGVNLAASLRSYAKLLRWRMLAAVHRPLETFDLVMGCDSLINVIKLLWKAKSDRSRFLPSRTQVYCVLWLFIHLAVTVLVGIIGLNYNLDQSTDYVILTKGTVSILSLDALSTNDYPADLAAVQTWGVRGGVTQPLDWDAEFEFKQTYYSDSEGHTFYYFQDDNANDPTHGTITSRYIEAISTCDGYRVIEGQYGDQDYIVYNDGSKDINETLPTQPGPGGLLALSKLNSTCGDRCVNVNAFQAESYPSAELSDDFYYVEQARFFICRNNVSQADDKDVVALNPDYLFSDLVARMLAGAIGWSANAPTEDGQYLYQVYTNASSVRFTSTPGEVDMANQISSFTMGAVSFMDDSTGAYRRYVSSTEQPSVAQYLHVTWRYAASILGAIPFIHFCTLLAVIAWANHAIIKDDSHLAIAKVYYTFLSRLGDRGCLLQGDEIVKVVDNPKVKYGYSISREQDGYLHVDVFDDSGNQTGIDGPFREGWYDGTGKNVNTRGRRQYRDIDATEYF